MIPNSKVGDKLLALVREAAAKFTETVVSFRIHDGSAVGAVPGSSRFNFNVPAVPLLRSRVVGLLTADGHTPIVISVSAGPVLPARDDNKDCVLLER
jgi:hypothetical protein